ncbi:MAG: hypothetical protein JW957_09230 [Candidatus Omnitrophica bacterium]|nr:hypothetical protein [Candidatus Omnitrophota bacterium]
MRRTQKDMKKLRLKIIDLSKQGNSYEVIRKKTGASPGTISKVLKGFTGRYCHKCGITNAEVLEEHHPDKINRPDETITLCANCHEEISRRQQRERIKKAQKNNTVPAGTSIISRFNIPETPIIPDVSPEELKRFIQSLQPSPPPVRPMTPRETKLSLLFTCGLAGVVNGLSPDNKNLKLPERVFLVAGGGYLLRQFFEGLKKP